MPKNVYGAYVLIGGGTGALDAIDGGDLADLDMAIVTTLTATYKYSLDADSAAGESSPTIIAPDANAGTKRWILTGITQVGTVPISTTQWGYLGGSTGIDHYVDRGDPAGFDKDAGDFITDGTWRTLNLSSVVPAGTTLIHIRLQVRDDVTGSLISLRENGNSNNVNIARLGTIIANESNYGDLFVACDVNRAIEYMGSDLAFLTINLLVRGWFIP